MMQYVFIHGLGQNSLSWNKTVSVLPIENQFVSPDLWTMLDGKEVSYANLYQAFSNLCNGLSGTLNLCGVSLGAVLALNYAVDYPEKVKSIVLIGGQYKMPDWLLKLQNILLQLMPKETFLRIGLRKKDIINLTNSMIGLDFSTNLKDISCPALILCGDKDKANKKASNGLADSIPDAKLRYIENAGHLVNTEAPQQLAEVLNAFWQEQLQ